MLISFLIFFSIHNENGFSGKKYIAARKSIGVYGHNSINKLYNYTLDVTHMRHDTISFYTHSVLFVIFPMNENNRDDSFIYTLFTIYVRFGF